MSNFWQQARQTLGRVFQGSKRSVEVIAAGIDRQATIQKLTGQIRGLERERSQLVITIGKKVYSLHTRGKVRNRDVLRDCVRIDETGQQIEQCQQQIEQIRRQAVPSEELVVEIEDEEPVTNEEIGAEEVTVEPSAPEAESAAVEPEAPAVERESPRVEWPDADRSEES